MSYAHTTVWKPAMILVYSVEYRSQTTNQMQHDNSGRHPKA